MALLVGNPLLHTLSLTRNSSSSSTCFILSSRKKNRIRIIRFPVNELSFHRCYRLSPVKSESSATASDYEIDIDDDKNDDITVNNNKKAISTANVASEANITISAGSFSRLKAHKIRSLALKTAKTIHNINSRDSDIVEESVVKTERLEQDRSNVSRYNKTVPKRESQKRQDMDRSEAVLNDDVAVSRASSASLRGWDAGRGRSDRWVRNEYSDRTKQSWKAPVDNSFFSQKSFREAGCNDKLIEFLRSQQIKRPSHIQALAYAPVLGLKSCIIADQSGSGKTLAYLLPVIQRIRQEELEGLSKSLPQSPRVVILVPTAELACQKKLDVFGLEASSFLSWTKVLGNCRRISKYGVPFRSMVATGGFSQKTQLESLQQNLDVVIATPGRFMFLVREGLLKLSNLSCAILDEVDILFNDEDYDPALQSLIKSSYVTTQYLFVTATLPTDIYNKLVEVFPDCEMIMGPGMHRTSPGLEEILVDCSGEEGTEKTPDTAFDNKRSALLKLVNEIPVAKTIIFCNKIETCRKVENVLKRVDRKGIRTKVLPFHSALAKESQLANMEEFCSPQLNTSLFLVCTDRASRGIDFAGVDHVVLFDYPRDPSEYVRRVGRTARGAGRKGKAFVFVVGKQVSLARRVIERNSKGHPLHDLPCANYEWF